MTTAVRYDPQLAMDEEALEDDTLHSLLEELADAKANLTDCRGRLDDYLDRLALDGIYRVGGFRLKVGQKRTTSISVPKPKKARR